MMEMLGCMSVQAALLIAVLLVLRKLFEKRIAPTVLYALWLLPAARLLFPGNVASAFSLQNWFAPKVSVQNWLAPKVSESTAAAARPSAAPGTVLSPEGMAPVTAPVSGGTAVGEIGGSIASADPASVGMGEVLFVLWLVGAAAVLLWALWQNIRFVRMAKRGAVTVEADCALPVYLSEHITSPCLCGIWKPVILVNDETLINDVRLSMALRHELAHWRGGDRFWAILRLLCCAVHWFNPLVWIAARVSLQDCERACDYRVLKHADQAERECYGALLLSYLQKPKVTAYSLLCASSPMGGNKGALRSRIALIGKKPSTKKLAAAVLAVCVAVTCLVACTGRLEKQGLYMHLAERAEGMEFAPVSGGILQENGDGIAGKTLQHYLDSRMWSETETALPDGSTELISYACGEAGGSLTVWQKDGAYWAEVLLEEDEHALYELTEADAATAWAMARIDAADTLRSAAGEDVEFVLVPAALSGEQKNCLFRGEVENGTLVYTPVDGAFAALHGGMADQLYFVDQSLGFAALWFDAALYRTENGGETWEQVVLPLEDVKEENGYSDIRIGSIEFTDKENGVVTVHFSYGSGALSCMFATADGGKTFGRIGGSPMLPEGGETTDFSVLPSAQSEMEVGWTVAMMGDGITEWVSENPEIASVDEKGLLTARAVGTTIVRGTGTEKTVESVIVVRQPGEVAWKLLMAQLDVSLHYNADAREITFTVPRQTDTANGNLHLDIWGKNAAGASEHFMEDSACAAGQSYTCALPEGEWTTLRMDVLYGESAASIDLMKLLVQEELSGSIVFDPQQRTFTFTIPEKMDTAALDLEIWAMERRANGTSELRQDLMAGTVYVPGESYTLSVAGKNYETLIMEYAYPNTGSTTRQIVLSQWSGYETA